MQRIEAVTVCVGYADFLYETAKWNRQFFDRWVIVTSEEDEETLDVCHRLNLDVVITSDFSRNGHAIHTDGRVFNKGRAIQRGLNAISAKEWILHLDADVVLPSEFPHALESAHLDPRKIYGCDRQNVVGWDAWCKLKGSGCRQHGYHCYVSVNPNHPIGMRWRSERDGYVPIGFFQLFHGSAMTRKGTWIRSYAAHHGHAARSDVQFGLQWDRRDRELLGEMLVWHLESEESKVGANWAGRTTRRFGNGPQKPVSSYNY